MSIEKRTCPSCGAVHKMNVFACKCGHERLVVDGQEKDLPPKGLGVDNEVGCTCWTGICVLHDFVTRDSE